MQDQTHLLFQVHMPRLEEQYLVLHQEKHLIPGGPVLCQKNLYARSKQAPTPDMGMLVYHTGIAGQEGSSYLELRYCMANNKYCDAPVCHDCANNSKDCNNHRETIDIYSFCFYADTLKNFFQQASHDDQREEVLSFRYPGSFTKTFTLCHRNRTLLAQLSNHGYSGALEKIYLLGKSQELLLYSLECLQEKKQIQFACKFLADQEGRNQIYKARDILLDNLGDPITIKELSRKVAMNECYLKKGFKEIYGTTIFEFYQQKRMEYAHTLLNEKGCNVTEVSAMLGYSSISHFSAAFKKYTGIKPCELLR